ncbi:MULTISPECIES: ABC transporter substrate-binding protein [Variovorax]|jgi:ABC-type nitrate/sulfonate/bicarbonate transport system substrate-binding protein|uniref:ABC transporter substrate-binding protein n=1 Tax=Variovorax TaxID=34072 RepID=UPI0008AC7225|nr:ABC transporter substrate-binding protein [Variovorax sp. OV084]SEU14939.1 ABC-type nitrate/sulfonate/bicarbonate transport system, substrate-binding protein [Variovorax sp. OV084]
MTDLLFSRASRRSWLKQGAALSLAAAGSLRVWAQPQQTTLVLGDQAGGLRSLFEASRTLEGAPFAYRWANFQGAAPLFEAQRSAAVDTAMAGDLPVLAAAVGKTPLKIVATRVGKADSLGIVVQPDSPLRSVADLRGKTVIVSSARGSISQYQLYGALEEAGVRREEVTVKFVLPTDAAAAFASKQIDAWAIFDPYYTIAVQQGGRILRDGRGINTALGFITASEHSLADPARRAAIVQFLDRLGRAGDWALANPEAYAQAYSQLTRLPIESSRIITARASVAGRPVSEADIVALQAVADRSARDGILPVRVDVRAITDTSVWKRPA